MWQLVDIRTKLNDRTIKYRSFYFFYFKLIHLR